MTKKAFTMLIRLQCSFDRIFDKYIVKEHNIEVYECYLSNERFKFDNMVDYMWRYNLISYDDRQGLFQNTKDLYEKEMRIAKSYIDIYSFDDVV